MNLQRALGSLVIPVIADPVVRSGETLPPDPDVGIRWGRKAAFDYSPSGRAEHDSDVLGFGLFGGASPEPPEVTRRLTFAGGASISGRRIPTNDFNEVTTFPQFFRWTRATFNMADNITVTFSHPIPKRKLGQGSGARRFHKYVMRRILFSE